MLKKWKLQFKIQKQYFDWRVRRMGRMEKRFPELFKNIKNKKVLDIGCGAEAPLSYYLSKKGVKIISGETNNKFVNSARKFARKANIFQFVAEKLPFKNGTFDIVCLCDVLEHVNNPYDSIKEAKRVCKKNGMIYIEFSPYWSLLGHHMYVLGFPKGYLPYQFMPTSLSKKIIINKQQKTDNIPLSMFEQFKSFDTEYIYNQFISLNKLSLSRFRNIIRKENLKIINDYYLISLPNNELDINFISKFPILNELLTFSYSGILRKSKNET